MIVTKQGIIKKVETESFKDVRRNGITAIKLGKGDELKFVELVSKGDCIILASKKSLAIR